MSQQMPKQIDLENRLIELRAYEILQIHNMTIKQLIHDQQILLRSYYPNSEKLDDNYKETPVQTKIKQLSAREVGRLNETLCKILPTTKPKINSPSKKVNEPDGSVKKKKKTISSTIKKLVWNTNIGEEFGKSKCMCCKSTDITQMSFNCGHVIAEANGGETIVSNLKPICQNCNSSMGTKNMNDFIKTLK